MTPENGFRTVIAGGTFPALIFGRFATAALAGTPTEEFRFASDASVAVDIDVERGCRANKWTPRAHIERRTFLRGTEPKAVCTEPTGPPATVVPSLLGLRVESAQAQLGAAGFLVSVQEVYDRTYPPGVVVGQVPATGAVVAPGARVTLQVSGGRTIQVTVPNLLGYTADEARGALAAVGLTADVVVAPSCTGGSVCDARLRREAGRVWRQDTSSGTRVRGGSSVRIAVGPRYTAAPPMSPTPSPSPTPAPSPTASTAPAPSPSSSPSPTATTS